MRIQTKVALSACLGLALAGAANADLNEGFDDITTLEGNGWFFQNNSNPIGVLDYFQGNPDVFSAFSGAPDSYIAVNYNSAADVGTISNWMLTPEMTLQNGDVLSFYTRATEGSTFPDRLQIYMSTAGGSTNVGTGAFDTGDFTTLLLDINPNYDQGGYPEGWTQYSIDISGLGDVVQGRIGFRYFVEDAGPFGNNSDYIGIDDVAYNAVPAPGALALLGLAGLASRRRRRA